MYPKTQERGQDGPQPPEFEVDFALASQELRSAFIEGLSEASALGDTPQELSRRLSIDKMLAWRVAQIVGSDAPYQWVNQVPGVAAHAKFIKALKKAGIPRLALQRLESAGVAYEEMVHTHVGDRSTLHAVISGIEPSAQPKLLLEARRLAYRGNSGTLGVQAETQYTTYVVARSTVSPDLADMVQLGGMVGFQRLRASVRWPLFRRMHWHDEATSKPVSQPLLASQEPGAPPWISSHCSSPFPDVEVVHGRTSVDYVVSAGRVGQTGSVDCAYGTLTPGIGPANKSGPDGVAEFGCNLMTPVRRLQLDVLIADDLNWSVKPDFTLNSRIGGDWSALRSETAANPIAKTENLVELGKGLLGISSPHVPRYEDLITAVFAETGWKRAGFSGWRLTMEVPPIPAEALITIELG